MKQTTALLLVIVLLLIPAHQLPAPIQEVPESPTPAPERQTKPTKTISKSRAVQSEPRSESTPKPSAIPTLPGSARFAGTWTGIINQGILGNIPITLVINSEGTSVILQWSGGREPHPATYSGNTLTWHAGWLNEITWTFTPAGDGKTAAVTSKSGFGVNGASIFQRTSDASTAGLTSKSSAQPSEVPVAKPVPGRPGFVYNPFDPTATKLLDVRSRASGTKVKDPTSGKLFVVP